MIYHAPKNTVAQKQDEKYSYPAGVSTFLLFGHIKINNKFLITMNYNF